MAVPVVPGPLRPLGPHPRDDLDEFIDEVLPDSDEGPGRFDVLLLVGGGGLLGWGAGMGGPEAATVIGALALGLGCILPVRWVWRAVIRHRVRRESLVLNLGDAETRRLVDAYEQIRAVSSSYATTKKSVSTAGVAAAHAALVEVATLLRGRPPAGEGERLYVAERADAIERFGSSLGGEGTHLLEARREVEELGGHSSVTRLRELTDEAFRRDD